MKKITLFTFCMLAIFAGQSAFRGRDTGISNVKHVVVIYMENHSFDNLWGQFPGADGLIDTKAEKLTQLDATGKPYTFLSPTPYSSTFPANLPNSYFNIDQYVAADQISPNVTHKFYQEQLQIDSGKMDKFALYNETKSFAMYYYKTADQNLTKDPVAVNTLLQRLIKKKEEHHAVADQSITATLPATNIKSLPALLFLAQVFALMAYITKQYRLTSRSLYSFTRRRYYLSFSCVRI